MTEKMHGAAAGSSPDVRQRGFTDRAPLAAAWTWLDALPGPGSEAVDLASATGRVLAAGIASHAEPNTIARAIADGYAVRASDCDGANAYNPLLLACHEPGAALLPPGAACPVASGWAMPSGTDAVLPFDAAERIGARCLEVLAPIAAGAGVDRHGHGLPGGLPILRRGRAVLPQHLACLLALGFTTLPVLPRPSVRLFVLGPKSGPDSLGPMLAALLARDGAMTETIALGSVGEPELAAALSQAGGGLVLIAGRSGAGPDDVSTAAVRAAGGVVALHGLALNPGGSAGLGMLSGAPVIVLPGDPFACLVAYDMLAARLLRRLAAADGALPYASVQRQLGRKVVSAIGLAEIIPVRTAGGMAHPVGAEAGLASLLADGFVMVPETSEGHPAGSTVTVHLYGIANNGPEAPWP